MKGILLAIFTLTAASMVVSPALAERRVAFVVGNARYEHTGMLANPRNDAQDVAEKLKALGFEVTLGLDLDQAAFAHAIDDFARRLDGADVGLFYYAGHALQMNEKNYLVSINAQLESAFLVPAETIELEPIVRLMESKASTNLIFLDACRNNPLADNLKRSLTAMQRSVTLGRGLVRIEPAARDTLIAFAAAPGQEASDGAGRNSPFTSALLKHIAQPGLEVSVMLKEVAAEVREKTDNAQRPQQLSDMSRTFYFAKAEAQSAPAATAPPSVQAEPEGSIELTFWRSANAANDCESMRAYLRRFPSGSFADLARISEKRLCAASTPTVATNAPRSQLASSPANAPASGSMPAAPAETAPTASQPPTTLSRLAPVTETKTDAALATDVVRTLQSELLRVGCGGDDQEADGMWSPAWQDALRRFNSSAHASLDPEHPSADAVTSIQGHQAQVCPLSCGPGREARDGRCIAKSKPSPEAAPHKRASRSQERNRREATRHPAAAGSSERRTARSSDNPPPLVPTVPGNPYRESYTYVGNKRCKTFEPPGAAPRVICP
ncbi:MAG TPA: caspase family protein [Xanthobacteraceae bacterium]|nr:caspase family protein [Xanthobacteraceae bacterium]